MLCVSTVSPACVHRRIREKYEAELREVERSEKGVLEKFSTMKVDTVTQLASQSAVALGSNLRRDRRNSKERAPGCVLCSGRRSTRWIRLTLLCQG